MSTSAAHNDCRKFHARFGNDALRFVSEPERRHRNLRGIYLRVVEEGEVAVGDVVEVVARAGKPLSHRYAASLPRGFSAAQRSW